jgi:DNA-binding transcriptional regulator LsrR (DeoR family)
MLSINAQMRKDKKELVKNLLKKDRDGLTIVEIARKLGISRNTVAVALAELKGAGLIRIRPVGIAKLHYWVFDKKGGDRK